MNLKVSITEAEKEKTFRVTWANDYFDASGVDVEGEPLPVGERLFDFLDGDSRHLRLALDNASKKGELLDLYLDLCDEVADWPFELLAHEKRFLVGSHVRVIRGVSDWGEAIEFKPQDRPLTLLFLASSPLDGGTELDFEKEEETIFRVTKDLAIDMEVEDSGSLPGLKERLLQDAYDIVHLSGHASINKRGKPYFVMESETGFARFVEAEELWQEALIENKPRLVFLSGCRTGEHPGAEFAAGSLARRLTEEFNVPAVLGWGRSVADDKATIAEQFIYRELSRGQSILDAVKRARLELRERFGFSVRKKPAWPLLRVFACGQPLGPLVTANQKKRVKPRAMKHVTLVESGVRVLEEGFVGRRRRAQRIGKGD
jgi:hypothetical protein